MRFLVVCRHTMDDIPIHLCESREEALVRAGALDVDSEEHPINPEYWDTDASTPCSVAIIEFNDAGIPVKIEVVRSFDSE